MSGYLEALMAVTQKRSIPLTLPTLLITAEDSANTATLVTAGFDVDPGDFVMVATFSRDGSSGTHAMSAQNCTITDIDTVRATDEDEGNNAARTTLFYGVVAAGTDSATDGTLTLTGSQAQFQQRMIAVKWAGGGRTIDQVKAAASITGTGLTITPDSTPNAAAISLCFYCQETTNGTPALASHTDGISAGGDISDLRTAYFAKAAPPPASWAITGVTDNGQARAGIGVTVL